jgi:hypothetical protein
VTNHTAEDYYRACAAEMMAKAQSAPSQAIREVYLNLALNWAQNAASGKSPGSECGTVDMSAAPFGKKI